MLWPVTGVFWMDTTAATDSTMSTTSTGDWLGDLVSTCATTAATTTAAATAATVTTTATTAATTGTTTAAGHSTCMDGSVPASGHHAGWPVHPGPAQAFPMPTPASASLPWLQPPPGFGYQFPTPLLHPMMGTWPQPGYMQPLAFNNGAQPSHPSFAPPGLTVSIVSTLIYFKPLQVVFVLLQNNTPFRCQFLVCSVNPFGCL